MSTFRQSGVGESLSVRDLLLAAHAYLGGRRGLLALAAAVAAAGLAFNWSWLVAVGAAPLILSALPCVAMCVLGLCMHKAADRSCSTEPAHAREVEPLARSAAGPTSLDEREDAEPAEIAPAQSAEDAADADASLPSPKERNPVNG